MKSIKRGSVYWVEQDPTVGAEINKRRPAVVVSPAVLNDHRLTVLIVPLSSKGNPRPPLIVETPSMGATATARIDQVRAIDKSRIKSSLGQLTQIEIEAIEQGLRMVMGL